jgi:hypothetical protein
MGIRSMADRHYEARQSPADPSYINVISTELAEDQKSAVVSVCVWDPVPVWEVHGVPDGSDALVNSDKSSFYRTYWVFLEAGEWRVGQTAIIRETKGRNTCGERS